MLDTGTTTTLGGDTVPTVRLRGLAKSFGEVTAVRPLDLDIDAGDFYAILGPSGCGKTTLLRMIGGFVEPSAGTVEIDGVFPHMSVRQNIAYGLRLAKAPTDEINSRVDEAIALVRMGEFAKRGVHELSGGQQQRVALARALVMRPKVLLLDEPLGALDLKLRQAMQEELRRIHHQIGGTFVFVTHDQGEALGLANRIAVMEEGVIVQEGGPEEIYSAPKTRFVSTFIGEANLLTGARRGGMARLPVGVDIADPGPDADIIVIVRPEAVEIGAEAERRCDIRLAGTLEDIVFLGSYVRCTVQLDNGDRLTAHSGDKGLRDTVSAGERIAIGWASADHRIIEDR
jgi:ABC-type Fe3+/spermidine/putrescine transport system ATPase subunit